jgi:hypothetical protein
MPARWSSAIIISQIPYATEQGINLAEQGILAKEHGILSAKAETIDGSAFGGKANVKMRWRHFRF